MTTDHFTLSLIAGAVAGALDVIPMIAQRLSVRSCLSAFLRYLSAGVVIFYSDLPGLPWWADGMAVTSMAALPVLLVLTGKERKGAPIILLNALLLGFLIGAAERYLG